MPPRASPIYFEQLTIENVRSFGGSQQLTLVDDHNRPARWTLIVGDNGVGKTTLLQCLARMAPVFNEPADDDVGPHPRKVEPELAREENNERLRALARNHATGPIRLSARFSVGARLKGLKRPSRHTIKTSLEFIRTRDGIANFQPDGNSSRRVKEPLVVGYSASRRPRKAGLGSLITKSPLASLLEIATELCDAEELLCRLDYSSLKGQRGATQFLKDLKIALSEILPDIQRPDDIEILGPRSPDDLERTGVHVKTPSGRVPLHQLSLGYQTVFAWTVDLAWRLLEHYPRSSKPLQQPVIVLVDEIDLHLHPIWQRAIRDRLKENFSQAQFIATAHSPLMAQSSLDANLAVVRWENDHAVIEDDPVVVESWRLDQLVTSDLVGLDSSRPPEIERQQKRRAELLQKVKLCAKERQELATLNHTFLTLQTETDDDERILGLIRHAAEHLQSGEDGS